MAELGKKTLYQRLLDREEKLAVVGLGYVGLPLVAAFARKVDVIGFDRNKEKIQAYLEGTDVTGEVGEEEIRTTSVEFTTEERRLGEAKFIIVAVPTPVNSDKTPDLTPLLSASELIGRNITKGSVVVFESTVYPGVTEELCRPVLEKYSRMRCGTDFKIGYSPERINPGDSVHRLGNITKIVSGIDQEAVEEIRQVYDMVIEAGTYPVSNIKTAEAVKVAENAQRDINIAFMNELAMVFDRMGIDTSEVIAGMDTKWNALGFHPGLVGGHCIGVDPYYFIYEAERLGYHSQIILAGRKINDSMSEFVVNAAVRQMILAGQTVRESKVAVLGITFKENCADTRNSKVIDMIGLFRSYGVCPVMVDPRADPAEVRREYGLELSSMDGAKDADCVVLAVAHREYIELKTEQLMGLFRRGEPEKRVLIDVKGIADKRKLEQMGYRYWRL